MIFTVRLRSIRTVLLSRLFCLTNAWIVTKRNQLAKKVQLENVAIANALPLEAARRRAVPYPLQFTLNSLCLYVAFLELFTAYTLRYAVTLTFDLEHV